MWGVPALLIGGLLYGVTGVPAGGKGCALLSYGDRHTQYRVSDGEELVSAAWDWERRLVSCSVDGDEGAVNSFIGTCRDRSGDLGGSGDFPGAKLACERFQRAETLRVPMDNDRTVHVPAHRVKRGFTYPGTLWCGAGNSADTYEDLGEKVETDICCRTHDHCAHVIHPFAYRYGYRSFLWHTISHCQCDNIFKECLRRVNDTTSRVVGQAFFNVIKVPCFEFQYKNLCVERYWYGQCKKYSNESVAVPKESGLYDFGGELIDQVSNSRDQYHTNTPALELSPEKPTLGQIVQATEDLLKLMITVSPGTSSDTSKLEETNKRKDKKKKEKKGRKHKKGKGLKGKRKGQFHDVKSGKDFWGEGIIKNDDKLLEQVLQLESKQEDFNDVLNDEPITNTAPTQYLSTIHTTSYKESKNILQSHSPFPKPFTEKPQKRNRQGKNGRQRKKKKSQTGSSVSDILN